MNKFLIVGLILLFFFVTTKTNAKNYSTGIELEISELTKNNIAPRIINGSIANNSEHSYYAALSVIPSEWNNLSLLRYIRHCGGTVLTNNFILTADYLESDFYRVKKVYIHSGYNEFSFNAFLRNDIALLELETTITHEVSKMNYKELNEDIYNQIDEWSAIGMGLTSNNSNSLSDTLLITDVNKGNDFSGICSERVSIETTLCTDDTVNGFGAICNGDSGGALVYKTNSGKYQQIGLSSYGSAICGSGLSVFTAVSAYEEWINEIIENGGISEVGGSDNQSGGSVSFLTLFGLFLFRKKIK